MGKAINQHKFLSFKCTELGMNFHKKKDLEMTQTNK